MRTTNEELKQQTNVLSQAQMYLANQKAKLQQTNDQLADALTRASRYKSEFLVNMSHELRTPLNSSLILARLLSENKVGNLTADQIKYAQTIYVVGNDLLNLINDILNLLKVEAGKLDLHIEDVPLQRIMDSLVRTFKPVVRQKNLTLRLELGNEIDGYPTLTTDFRRLEQILKNLLSNAVKFTDTGVVSLTLKRAVQFVVTDTGIGIAQESGRDLRGIPAGRRHHQPKLRTAARGWACRSRAGLAHLLSDAISLHSTLGAGSTFTLTLPLVYAAAGPPCRLCWSRRRS